METLGDPTDLTQLVDLAHDIRRSTPAITLSHGKLTRLINLARDRSPDARADMVDAIGAFVVDRADTASVAEMSLASDVLQRLMRDVETTVRRKLAERLAPEPKAPPALIRLLANDEAEVARPVLAASEALQDEDLLEVVRHKTMQHRLAISLRRDISEHVSSSLIEAGEPDVDVSLSENKGARLSRGSLETLVERARTEPRLGDPLVHRADLDPALATRLYGWASASVRRYIVANFDVDPVLLDAAIRDSIGKASAEQRLLHETAQPSETLGREIDAAFADDPHVLIKLLRAGEVGLFEASFARITGLPPTIARRAIYEPGGRAMAVACRATGIEKPIFAAIFLLARRGRPGDKTVDPMELPAALTFFDSVDNATAKRTIDHLRIAAAQRRVN
jgi:uncharacterized protein (DUF2336 family)